MCQSHATRPQPIKLVPKKQKKLYVISLGEIPENLVHKSCMYIVHAHF